jgi:hypothetical protein
MAVVEEQKPSNVIHAEERFLSLDEILAKSDTQYEVLDVPQWGGKIRIGSLPGDEFVEWTEANEGEAKKTAGARIILKSLVDANGTRIGDLKKLEQMKKRDTSVINYVVQKILLLNGVHPSQQKALLETKNGSSGVSSGSLPTS